MCPLIDRDWGQKMTAGMSHKFLTEQVTAGSYAPGI